MPAPLDIDKEAARVLVVAVGPREAARQLGIPEPTVQAWSARGNWLAPPPAPPLPVSMRGATVATKPADALQNTLLARKDKSALHLSKYVVDASSKAAKSHGDLELASDVRQVAAIRSSLYPEDQAGTTISLNIGFFGG